MNKVIFILVTIISGLAVADTECLWINKRDGATFETITTLRNAKDINHCFHVLKKPVVLTEPAQDGNEFEGVAIIREIDSGNVVESCPTLTVNGLDWDDPMDQGRLLLFIQDVHNSGDSTGETTTNSEKWQNYFNSKIKLACH